jgi:hypothetical protein
MVPRTGRTTRTPSLTLKCRDREVGIQPWLTCLASSGTTAFPHGRVLTKIPQALVRFGSRRSTGTSVPRHPTG